MNIEDFDKLLNNRLNKIKETLSSKAKEYASGDRLYNFKYAAKINNISQEKALWGMATKHLVSVIDLVNGRINLSNEIVDEKIGDMINYLILLEAVLKEKINREIIFKAVTGKCGNNFKSESEMLNEACNDSNINGWDYK